MSELGTSHLERRRGHARPADRVDLAARRRGHRRSCARAPVVDRVRQLAQAGRTADRATQRDLRGAPARRRSDLYRRAARCRERAVPAVSGARRADGRIRADERLGARRRRPGLARARTRAPRFGQQRAARHHRRRPQVRPAALRRGDLEPRTRHRHGRRRPRRAGRVAAVGRERTAAGRPGRPPGGRGVAGHPVPEAPGRPHPFGCRCRTDDLRTDRVAARPDEPARHPRPADRRRRRARTGRRRTTGSTPCDAAPRSPRSPGAPTTRHSTCSPVATRPTNSPNCVRASSGTATRGP